MLDLRRGEAALGASTSECSEVNAAVDFSLNLRTAADSLTASLHRNLESNPAITSCNEIHSKNRTMELKMMKTTFNAFLLRWKMLMPVKFY